MGHKEEKCECGRYEFERTPERLAEEILLAQRLADIRNVARAIFVQHLPAWIANGHTATRMTVDAYAHAREFVAESAKQNGRDDNVLHERFIELRKRWHAEDAIKRAAGSTTVGTA